MRAITMIMMIAVAVMFAGCEMASESTVETSEQDNDNNTELNINESDVNIEMNNYEIYMLENMTNDFEGIETNMFDEVEDEK